MKKNMVFIFMFFGVILFGISQEKTFKPVVYPSGYMAQIDVVYTHVNGWDGRMDLYTNPTAENPTPVVINIHGGGWNHGEKESHTGYSTFFKNGYAVVNVEYRLVDVAPAPAAIQDVRCALIYVHQNAKALNIDPNKIVIMGGSAGGHLALMAGLLGKNKQFDTNCSYDETINVAAIINKYGLTDLMPLAHWKSAKNWLGFNNIDNTFIESVSPINYVSEKSPPIFIVHGDADPIVSYEQSVLLYKKLKANFIKTRFLTIKNGKHGNFNNAENRRISKSIWKFLNNLNI